MKSTGVRRWVSKPLAGADEHRQHDAFSAALKRKVQSPEQSDTGLACRNLVRAVQQIARDNPDATVQSNDAVLDAARRLRANPHLGRIAPVPFLLSCRF